MDYHFGVGAYVALEADVEEPRLYGLERASFSLMMALAWPMFLVGAFCWMLCDAWKEMGE